MRVHNFAYFDEVQHPEGQTGKVMRTVALRGGSKSTNLPVSATFAGKVSVFSATFWHFLGKCCNYRQKVCLFAPESFDVILLIRFMLYVCHRAHIFLGRCYTRKKEGMETNFAYFLVLQHPLSPEALWAG